MPGIYLLGLLSHKERVMTFPRPDQYYFRKVNLELTTVCNLACPDCSAGINMGLRDAVFHPWEYFVEAARWLKGFDSLVCIGGEPTAHPKFAEFVPKFRELFGCREMILWTNGFKVKQHADVIRDTFDAVYTSLYDERTAGWNKRSNAPEVQFIKGAFKHSTMEDIHIPRSRRGSGEICERGIHGPVTYADGMFYGCCVAQGMSSGIGVKPSENWRTELVATALPCAECCFSPGMAA